MQHTNMTNYRANDSQNISSNIICGFPISTATLENNLKIIDALAESCHGGWVVTLNTEMLAKSTREEDYAALLKQADFITADGMPLIWASQYNGQLPIEGRSTGVDIVEAFLQRDHIPLYAIIGGVDPETTIKKYPNALKSCAYLFTGLVDLSEKQLDEFSNTLRDKNIRYVFIALNVPKSDKVAFGIRARYSEAVIIGVGGTFEILSPNSSRAPQWMQKSGLEWLYRFIKEPRRLWRRYILNYPAGIRALIKDKFKK